MHKQDFKAKAHNAGIPSARDYLKEVTPYFLSDLEEKRLRGKVCEVMENYAILVAERFNK